jgi:RHS repeat-associated protein
MGTKKPNWNAAAISGVMGNVSERYKYDGFGRRTVLSADAVVEKTSSEYAWNRAFTGQVLDSETGLMLYRNRYYHTGLGRFVNRDPIGYKGMDINLYRYVENKPTIYVDIYGHSPFDDQNKCVRECKNACTLQFGKGWWYPGKYLQYSTCIQSCKMTCTPNFPYLPSSSPECNKYPCDYLYSGTNARCFCKCAGDSDWSQYVRGCLRYYYDLGYDPTYSHVMCYKYGTQQHGTPPTDTLAYCVAKCQEIISLPSFAPYPTIPINPQFPIPFDRPIPIPQF